MYIRMLENEGVAGKSLPIDWLRASDMSFESLFSFVIGMVF